MKQAVRWLAVFVAGSLVLGGLSACSYPSYAPYEVLELKDVPPAPGELSAKFLGVTTILFEDGTTSVMTDGFFSRPPMLQTAVGMIGPDQARIDDALRRAGVGRLDLLLVAHSHYDHALDSGRVARQTGALLVGSESTANIGLGERVDGILVIEDREVLRRGDFFIEVIKSPHSPIKSPNSLEVRFPGKIEGELKAPAHASRYREGGNFSFLIRHGGINVLVHPSAGAERGRFANVRADVVFLGIGTLGQQDSGFIENYWCAVVQQTGAKLVIPTHWDDFFEPLQRPLRPMPSPLDSFEDGMKAIMALANRDGVAVRFMPVFETVGIKAALRDVGVFVASPRSSRRKKPCPAAGP